jgi:hypothetical protein
MFRVLNKGIWLIQEQGEGTVAGNSDRGESYRISLLSQ